jgi:broad specificity phosphatase PhoE
MKKMQFAVCKILPVIGFAAAAFLAGCGDDSSTSDPGTQEPSTPGAEADAGSSASAAEPGTGGESGSLISATLTTERTLDVVADSNGFFDVADIYKAAPSDYKIAFVLRHAERESGLGQESPLTEVGEQQAFDLGARMGGDEAFYYASTDFIRTRETCNNIAKGRGETGNEVVTWDGLNGTYFLKISSDSLDVFAKQKGGSWKIIAVYAYGEDYYADEIQPLFYDFYERGQQFVMENIVANMPQWKRVSVLVTHDLLIEPLVVYASNRTVDVNFYTSKRWVNYLTGIAVVINTNNQVELYPVRGVDVGFMTQSKTNPNATRPAATITESSSSTEPESSTETAE